MGDHSTFTQTLNHVSGYNLRCIPSITFLTQDCMAYNYHTRLDWYHGSLTPLCLSSKPFSLFLPRFQTESASLRHTVGDRLGNRLHGSSSSLSVNVAGQRIIVRLQFNSHHSIKSKFSSTLFSLVDDWGCFGVLHIALISM